MCVAQAGPLEYSLWIRPDCAETPYETNYRTWFYFSVSGVPSGSTLSFRIMNMNKQHGLYAQDYRPITRALPGAPRWERTPSGVHYEVVDGHFQLSWRHRCDGGPEALLYFAFCYPHSYSDCQTALGRLDATHRLHGLMDARSEEGGGGGSAPPAGAIYYHRELLTRSVDGRRVDLLTITSYAGRRAAREERLEGLFPEGEAAPRAHEFGGKPIVLVSARVHPGETPASYMFDGLLELLLRPEDPRAVALRKQFVFKLVRVPGPGAGASRCPHDDA